MIKEGFDMGFIEISRMLLVVEDDVLADPVAIALFGARTVMTATNGNTQLFE